MGDLWGAYGWDIIGIINFLILLYFLAINLSYLTLVTISFFYIKKQYKTLNLQNFTRVFKSDLYPSYSIIVPVYNQEDDVIETVNSLLQQQYGDFEIIVVNDGSTDSTLNVLKGAFELYASKRYMDSTLNHQPIRELFASKIHPNLFVVDKKNGQKADAMNAGLNVARKDLFCAVDDDSVLESDVLVKMLRSFAQNEETIAVGGIIRVANGCSFENNVLTTTKTPTSFIPLIQVIEYVRSFIFGRTGWEYFGGLVLISGAFGVFDRRAVLKVGGYYKNAICEDLDLTVKLHKYYKDNNLPHKINFQPEPVCWTKVPDSWTALSSQRNRWQRGLFQTLFRFKSMIFNPRYRFVGLVTLPFYLIFELFGPIIEFLSYLIIIILLFTGLLPPETGLLFFIVAILLGVLLSVVSLLCDELTYHKYPRFKDLLKLGFVSIFETFGYRQLHTWWRIKGMYAYIKGEIDWSNRSSNPELINTIYWIAFILTNVIIIYLFYYGIKY